jgi:hypothetical protein
MRVAARVVVDSSGRYAGWHRAQDWRAAARQKQSHGSLICVHWCHPCSKILAYMNHSPWNAWHHIRA